MVAKKILIVGLYIILLIAGKDLSAQISISAGAGIPEFVNLEFRIHRDQKGLGINIGTLPGREEFVLITRASGYYHFAGKRGYSLIKPWYLNPGITYYRGESNTILDQHLFVDLRIGREYSINHFWGIFTELGIGGAIWEETYNKNTNSLGKTGPILFPSLGIGFYYRFQEGCNCPKIKTKA